MEDTSAKNAKVYGINNNYSSMKMKKFFQIFVSMILFAVAVVTGGGVMAAAAVALDGGGTGKEGESSYTNNEEIADEEYYQKDIDERVVKVRPLQTPVTQSHARQVLTASAIPLS